jgi:hypothetical protein
MYIDFLQLLPSFLLFLSIKNKTMPKVYDNYTQLKAWSILENTINDLKINQDLTINTDPYYIIGYILKSFENHNLLKDSKVEQ